MFFMANGVVFQDRFYCSIHLQMDLITFSEVKRMLLV